jgi:small GTP-binding protein
MVDFRETGPETPEKIKRVLKFLVIGEPQTGKTALIRRYVQNCYTEHYRSTIGVDFAHKDVDFDANTSVTIQLWDVSGSQRFSELTRMYYQGAVGAFVVFDVTNPKTLDAAVVWKRDIDEKVLTANSGPLPVLLVGNKIDLRPDGWDKSMLEMNEFRTTHSFVGYIQTSAKSSYNVDEAVRALVHYVIENSIQAPDDRTPDGIDLNADKNADSPCCS